MSKESSSANKRQSTDKNRDKRFFENLRSSLGNGQSSQPRNGKPKRSEQIPQEDITLSDALQQITICNQHASASVADVKPLLLKKIDQFTKDDFTRLTTMLCDSAMEQTNIYFVLEICIDFIEYPDFQFAMSECLKNLVGNFLSDDGEKFNTLPNILAHLMINRWPRKFNRAIESSNLILFTASNTIIGWTKFVNSKHKKDDQHNDNEKNQDLTDGDQQTLFIRCVQGLLAFCDAGQRYLWLNYPDLFDEIYNNVCVELLISNINLPRPVKSSLLNLCQQMMKWSQANTPKYLSAATQTVGRGL